jgi:hypothetical protein
MHHELTEAPVSHAGVARVAGCWYAQDVFALLAAPTLPAALRAELEAWVATQDINVSRHRPFAVLPDGTYVFDWRFRQRQGAPTWWVDAARQFTTRYPTTHRTSGTRHAG